MTDTFRHNPELSRYELEVDGLLAVADYQRAGHRLVIPHVEADMALRGTGAAGRLMQQIIALAREKNLQLVPRCGYAVAWFKRHPDDADVLD